MKVRVPPGAGLTRFLLGPVGRYLVIGLALFICLGLGTFTYFYAKYSRLIDAKLRVGPFANTAKIFAAPASVAVGDVGTPAEIAAELRRSGYNESRGNPIGYYLLQPNSIEVFPGPESYFDQEGAPASGVGGDGGTPAEIAAELRRSGYNESRGNPIGYYLLQPNSIEVFPGPESYFDQEGAPASGVGGDGGTPAEIAAELRRSGYNESRGNPIGYYLLQPNSIEVFPGPESYFDQEAGVVKFAGGRISQIVSLQDNTTRSQYQLEPQLITNVSGPNREKRRMVKFADIPPVLVEAVVSAEDKRFFQHAGFDPIRIVKAAYVDLKEGRNAQGASTLSQQLARMFWLDTGKRWTRKLAEMIITLQLEQKLSKDSIFEDYANDIYLGWRGSFRIHGFGEAAEAYLGKDLSQITLPEAAELAGMIQRPALYAPFPHPDRLRERRNAVLVLMHQNGFINEHDYALAYQAPLTVGKSTAQSVEAP